MEYDGRELDLYVTFTIQNVSIKLQNIFLHYTNTLYLQYKMFLLNPIIFRRVVAVKFYLQYKMFLLNDC